MEPQMNILDMLAAVMFAGLLTAGVTFAETPWRESNELGKAVEGQHLATSLPARLLTLTAITSCKRHGI